MLQVDMRNNWVNHKIMSLTCTLERVRAGWHLDLPTSVTLIAQVPTI